MRGALRLISSDGDACSNRQKQRRDLCNQAIAYGQYRKLLDRGPQAQIHRQSADGDAAQQVHQHDDDARNGVAFDEFHGAVHGTIELAFLDECVAANHGIGLCDQPCAHVCVNAHLLAGQRIQREAGTYLCHSLCTLGDHDELNNGDDQKHHDAHHQAAAHHQFAKGRNDVAGVCVQQNLARGCNAERNSKQRRDEQH